MTADARRTMAVLGRIDGPDLAAHPERCVLVRNRNASCLRCAEACTSGAISADEDGLVIRPELCIGCGTCATACPTCALEPQNPDDQALARAAAHVARQAGGSVVLACPQAVEDAAGQGACGPGGLPDGWVEVACLGRVDATELVELAARGAQRVVLACGECVACPHAAGAAVRDRAAADAEELLACYGRAMDVEVADAAQALAEVNAEFGGTRVPSFALARLAGLPATPPEALEAASDEVARREGFEDGRYCKPRPPEDGGAQAAGSGGIAEDTGPQAGADAPEGADGLPKLPHVGADGALPQFVPTRRTRLFNCLKALGAPAVPDDEPVQTGLWGTVSIDPGLCDSCRMCAVFCPTGALRRTPEGAPVFGLTHQPTFCVQCRTCEAICPHRALHVEPAVTLGAFTRGRRTTIEMPEPDWKPNRPDSIYRKVFGMLGADKNNLAVY